MDFAGDQPREYARPTTFQDLMNPSINPVYATNNKGKERDFEEPDTCRICRGEGTEEEQLFYPCKCSGSIKFVHQACLVEWLSHSQKKHCELCKTPFRFTKLYDPNMPQNLPAPLFIKQIFIHSVRTIATWLRFVLVAFVWLGWLPWSMRAIWRALFWLADGHWSGGENSQKQAQDRLAQLVVNSTTSIDASISTTSSAVLTAIQSSATDAPSMQSPVSSMFGFPSGEPLPLTLIKKVLSVLFFPTISSTAGSAGPRSSNMTTISYKQRHPSFLSDVRFLNSLTPSPTINNILIDTLEGQLITLLVVISFILVFLIREWVVQQQPMANIADGEREAAVQLIANNRANQDADEPRPEPPDPLRLEDLLGEEETSEHGEGVSDHGDDVRYSPSVYSETSVGDSFARGERPTDLPAEGPSTSSFFHHNSDSDDELPTTHNARRPSAQINQGWPGVETFRDLWSRGNGDPEQVLRIVREEGRQEELGWVITAMTRLQRNDTTRLSGNSYQYPSDFASSSTHRNANEAAMEETGATFAEPSQMTFPNHAGSTLSAPTHRHLDTIPSQSRGNDMNTGSSHRSFTFNLSDHESDHAGAYEEQRSATSATSDRAHDNQAPSVVEASIVNSTLDVDNLSSENIPPPSEIDRPTAAPPRSLAGKVFDWFWGDITPDGQGQERPQQDDEQLAEDPALEAPFIPIQNNRRVADGGIQGNQGIAADAGIDANDIDAVEEGDDLEGILELIGMQGPIFGLLQNGVFSALLISFTVAIGIWLPYLWGKIALVLLANPIQLVFGVPVTAVRVFADVTLDILIGSLGYLAYWVSLICKVLLGPFGSFVPLGDWIPPTTSITNASLSLIDASGHRLRNVLNSFFVFHESDVPMFSVISHQALKIHEARISSLSQSIFIFIKFTLYDLPLQIMSLGSPDAPSFDYKSVDLSKVLDQAREQIYSLGNNSFLSTNEAKWLNATVVGPASVNISSVDYDSGVWETKDRIIAIVMGYLLASALGLLYLRISGLLSGVDRGQRVGGIVADVLHQAGGVMKVILIIGIEMIVFPLYCGSLLDLALLPLFENATIASRLDFTSSSPLTSLFVHWFIGTCYMFHFALFVSMCRKIMRSGVLYFIRDPDDPTFHPVRDVLERNITTQLRKIAFSALVYGALVIVCLGGVVWGLYYAFDGVLPIHWSATIPVLEFPVDLLFYNFVMPLAIRSIKPSDSLQDLYNWWFHKCARFLRLTNFFFGERQTGEEGYHVRRTWWDVLSGKKGDIEHPVIGEEQMRIVENKHTDTYFLRDGRFVRAPASDQVRIPKGSQVFLEVTETNERVDGAPDTDEGLHGRTNDMFTKVYIPPFFRSRIAAFILLIWVFAATTGVGTTIIPLVIGRKMLSSYVPNRPVNDIYAFSMGICTLGGAAYVALYCRTYFAVARDRLSPYLSPQQAFQGLVNTLISGARLIYIFAAFSILVPSLFALVMELYLLVPVHTYLRGTQGHVIHFVQDWTLGVLYVQMAIKFALWHPTSRPAAALNSIFRDGWMKPNVSLATRALILPITLVATVSLTLPLSFGFALNSTAFRSMPDVQIKVYRYAYPVTLLMSLMVWLAYRVRRQVEIWRVNIRDDVYLIGERLHNFREKRARDVGVPRVITG